VVDRADTFWVRAARGVAAAEQVVAAAQLFAAEVAADSHGAAEAEAWAAIPAVLDALSSPCFPAAAGSKRGAYWCCCAYAGVRWVSPCDW
jgi:hypothetical protein